MKALYTNESHIKLNMEIEEKLKPFNYDTRYQALKENYKFVHLFESKIKNDKTVNVYYSSMKL